MVVVMLATDLWVASSREAQAGLLPSASRQAMRDAGAGCGPGPVPGSAALSALIFQNNVQVSFLAFALGITFGIGTIWVITTNAVFIGLLAGGFQAAGEGWTFWALVLPHGFLELTAICIAGGAGLRMGWAMIDPGDRGRVTALGEEARDAVLLILGAIPAFAVAAVIEGFVTGRTGAPIVEVADRGGRGDRVPRAPPVPDEGSVCRHGAGRTGPNGQSRPRDLIWRYSSATEAASAPGCASITVAPSPLIRAAGAIAPRHEPGCGRAVVRVFGRPRHRGGERLDLRVAHARHDEQVPRQQHRDRAEQRFEDRLLREVREQDQPGTATVPSRAELANASG